MISEFIGERPMRVKQYLQDGTLSAAKAISAFSGYSAAGQANAFHIQPLTQSVRVRTDGTAPTSTVGTLVPAGGEGIIVFGDPANIKIIETAVSASCNVTTYLV